MYTVALNTNKDSKTYSLTVRDLARNAHWQNASAENCIRDTRESEIKHFYIVGEFDTESDARKFAGTFEAAYALGGYTREMVKVEA